MMHGYREDEYPAPEPMTPEREARMEIYSAALAKNAGETLHKIQMQVFSDYTGKSYGDISPRIAHHMQLERLLKPTIFEKMAVIDRLYAAAKEVAGFRWVDPRPKRTVKFRRYNEPS